MKKYNDWYMDTFVSKRETEIKREHYEMHYDLVEEDIDELKNPHKD